jgi:hypothetical protein
MRLCGIVGLLSAMLLFGCAKDAPALASSKEYRPGPWMGSLPVSSHPTAKETFEHGFIPSPFAPSQGYIDIRGIPTGTEVRDPYTGKVFILEPPKEK